MTPYFEVDSEGHVTFFDIPGHTIRRFYEREIKFQPVRIDFDNETTARIFFDCLYTFHHAANKAIREGWQAEFIAKTMKLSK